MRPPAVLSRLTVVACLVLAWLLGAAGPAAAHPALVGSAPGAGYAVTDAPREIALSFSEPVTLPDRPLVVTTQEGASVALRVTTTQQGAGLVAPRCPARGRRVRGGVPGRRAGR